MRNKTIPHVVLAAFLWTMSALPAFCSIPGQQLWDRSGSPAQELINAIRRLRHPDRPDIVSLDLSGLKKALADLRSNLDAANNPPAGIGVLFGQSHSTVVERLLINGPAEETGIHIGDEFIAVNGHPVKNFQDVINALSADGPSQVQLKGRKRTVTLAKKKPQYLSPLLIAEIESEYAAINRDILALEAQAKNVGVPAAEAATATNAISSRIQQLSDKLLQAQIKSFDEKYRTT